MDLEKKRNRKAVNTTLDQDLYKQIKTIAFFQEKDANDLLEEGMEMVIEKYNKQEQK